MAHTAGGVSYPAVEPCWPALTDGLPMDVPGLGAETRNVGRGGMPAGSPLIAPRKPVLRAAGCACEVEATRLGRCAQRAEPYVDSHPCHRARAGPRGRARGDHPRHTPDQDGARSGLTGDPTAAPRTCCRSRGSGRPTVALLSDALGHHSTHQRRELHHRVLGGQRRQRSRRGRRVRQAVRHRRPARRGGAAHSTGVGYLPSRMPPRSRLVSSLQFLHQHPAQRKAVCQR